MEEKAIRGVPWTLLSYGVDRVVGLVTTMVLARLLAPADFGLMALGVLVITVINLLSGLGLGGALVVRRDLDERAQGTVLTLLLATGAAFGGILALLSPFAADAFGEPRLTGILLALAGLVVFNGLSWFYTTVLQRELEFKRRFASIAIQTLVGSVVTIVLAALGVGVWSLIVGVIVGTAVYTALVIVLSPYRVRPAWDRGAARSLFSSGRGFLLQGATAFVQLNTDYVVVSRVLGTTPLGYYSMAYRLGELPQLAIADPIARVTFPSFARMRERREDVLPSYLTALRLVALVACPVGIILSGAAEPFTRTLLGDQWLPLIGPLSIFGVWASVRVLEVTVGWLLNSVDQAAPTGRISLVLLVAHIPTLVLAAHLGGIGGVAWAMLGHMVVFLAAVVWLARLRIGLTLRRHWEAIRPVAIAAVASWVTTRIVAEASADAHSILSLLASVAAGLLAYVVVVWLVEPSLPRSAIQLVGRSLSRPPASARA